MKLARAFGLSKGEVVAFIGAGGKTSALVGLGYELMEQGWRVLATTTTRIGVDQLDLMPFAMRYDASPIIMSQALSDHRFVFLYDSIRQNKVFGGDGDWIRRLLDAVDSDVLLVEADGARGRLFKALKPHEPMIPSEATLVVQMAALSVLDKPLNEQYVYNPQAMHEKYGFFPETPIQAPWVAQILRDEELGWRGAPSQARIITFLNQVPLGQHSRQRARTIARLTLKASRIDAVAIGSVRAADPIYEVQKPIGAVVLAAGLSSRMGQHKILLPWQDGKTIIEHIVEQLVRSRLEEIVVVLGHQADAVKRLLKPYGVTCVINKAYKNGEMLVSMQTGLKALSPRMAAALIVLGDQPRMEPRTIYKVLKAYAEGQGDIVMPSYQRRRGHPYLLDRCYWQDILALKTGQSAREVMNANEAAIAYVEVSNDSILCDIDTPQDYREERERAGLNPHLPTPPQDQS
ncbi:MAG: selenium cofactor biosynthesis protein YqeC [Anaerolineae bacterium]|nr:selenium cofactor biosynthesis protein YqeC [Anaerolineae bacterium]MDW8171411.1 selenium cofactor biosynthesis protein YqeC [Anaerolineae bacterium]